MLRGLLLRASRLHYRQYATGTSTSPPMLLKIRKDLKSAMQKKDSNRLAVLKGLLTQTLNASKTAKPIQTDMHMLALFRKSISASKAASEEFMRAGRQDLVDKEESQIKVLEEYSSSVEVMSTSDIRRAIDAVVAQMRDEGAKLQMRDVLKRLFSRDFLEGKPVDKGEAAQIVKLVLAES